MSIMIVMPTEEGMELIDQLGTERGFIYLDYTELQRGDFARISFGPTMARIQSDYGRETDDYLRRRAGWPRYVCPHCKAASSHPDDIKARYCGSCHRFGDFDHEHPCPSSGCITELRRQGVDIPDGTECCLCWLEAAGLRTREDEPHPGSVPGPSPQP